MPFPLFPEMPVLSTEGRFFLPPDTEDAFGLCAKLMEFFRKQHACQWSPQPKRDRASRIATDAAKAAREIDAIHKELYGSWRMIPPVLHQTFRSAEEIPATLQPLMETWGRIHPDWEFRFWSDADCDWLLHEFYPELVHIHEMLRYRIQRSDFMRYLFLHHEGGVYADLDYELLSSFDPYRDREYFLAELHEGQVGNALMGSVKGWQFWMDFVERIPESIERAKRHGLGRNHEILYTTGPGHLDYFAKKRGLQWEPWQMFSPVPDTCTHLLQLGPTPNGAVAKHWWNAGWINGETYIQHPHMARTQDNAAAH